LLDGRRLYAFPPDPAEHGVVRRERSSARSRALHRDREAQEFGGEQLAHGNLEALQVNPTVEAAWRPGNRSAQPAIAERAVPARKGGGRCLAHPAAGFLRWRYR
jgi:hypothetical protein